MHRFPLRRQRQYLQRYTLIPCTFWRQLRTQSKLISIICAAATIALLCLTLNFFVLSAQPQRARAEDIQQHQHESETRVMTTHFEEYSIFRECEVPGVQPLLSSASDTTTANAQTMQWAQMKNSWDKRGQIVAAFASDIIVSHYNDAGHDNKNAYNVNVFDFGCGKMTLKPMMEERLAAADKPQLLSALNLHYVPIDAFKRNADTIVCDFNRYEFPFAHLKAMIGRADISIGVCQGCSEYVYDKLLFLKSLKHLDIDIVFTYAFNAGKANDMWVTQLKTEEEILYLFQNAQFKVLKAQSKKGNRIYHLS